jgi:hypothetical protein
LLRVIPSRLVDDDHVVNTIQGEVGFIIKVGLFSEFRDGYVEGIDIKNKSLYSTTPKGRKLLKGWIAFISAYS